MFKLDKTTPSEQRLIREWEASGRTRPRFWSCGECPVAIFVSMLIGTAFIAAFSSSIIFFPIRENTEPYVTSHWWLVLTIGAPIMIALVLRWSYYLYCLFEHVGKYADEYVKNHACNLNSLYHDHVGDKGLPEARVKLAEVCAATTVKYLYHERQGVDPRGDEMKAWLEREYANANRLAQAIIANHDADKRRRENSATETFRAMCEADDLVRDAGDDPVSRTVHLLDDCTNLINGVRVEIPSIDLTK